MSNRVALFLSAPLVMAMASCSSNEDPAPALSGRSIAEETNQYRTTTDWFSNFTFRDSSYNYDADNDTYYLTVVSEGTYSLSGDTLRFQDFAVLFHLQGCAMTGGDYKQSDYTLFRLENDDLYLNYNYTLQPAGHSGQGLDGRWEYSHHIATRGEEPSDTNKGTRHYYFVFDDDDKLYEFGWADDFESCFKNNTRYNGYIYTPPLLDLRPVPVHPNYVNVSIHEGQMHWTDANGFVKFPFERR